GHHPRLELLEALVHGQEDLLLGAGEDLLVPGAGQRDRDDGGHGGVEAVLARVRLDVEAVDRRSPAHRLPLCSRPERREGGRGGGGWSGWRQRRPGIGSRVVSPSRRTRSGVSGSSTSSKAKVTASSPSPWVTSVSRAPRGSGGSGR